MELTQELIYRMIDDKRLKSFWLNLTDETKQMIVDEYNRNLIIDKEVKNQVQCLENGGNLKLIIEENSGLHFCSSTNLPSLIQSKMLKPQALINGHSSIKNGNIAPYCVHFVKVPLSFLLEDFKNKWEQMGQYYESIPNAHSFGWCCNEFLSMHCFMPNPYMHFTDIIPLIFIYKRKKFDIDIMNDQELDIHKDFYRNSYLVDFDDYGYPEFHRFIDKTMAILGGINIKSLDGIIISKYSFGNLKIKSKQFSTFNILIEYLISEFPQLYISDECGNILYMPEKNKVILKKEIKDPFIKE